MLVTYDTATIRIVPMGSLTVSVTQVPMWFLTVSVTQVPDHDRGGVQEGSGWAGPPHQPGGAEHSLLPGQTRVMATLTSGQDACSALHTQKVRPHVMATLSSGQYACSALNTQKVRPGSWFNFYLVSRVEWFSTFFFVFLKPIHFCQSCIFCQVRFQKIDKSAACLRFVLAAKFLFQKITGNLKINIFLKIYKNLPYKSKNNCQKNIWN